MPPGWQFESCFCAKTNCFCVGAKTYVLWDIDDCPSPDGLTSVELMRNIGRALENMGYSDRVEFRAYGDISRPIDLRGFFLFGISSGNVTRKKILVDLFRLALLNRESTMNVLLILGDISRDTEYLRALDFVKSRHYHNILLSQPKEASLDCVNTNLLWQDLAAGSSPTTELQSEELGPSSVPFPIWAKKNLITTFPERPLPKLMTEGSSSSQKKDLVKARKLKSKG